MSPRLRSALSIVASLALAGGLLYLAVRNADVGAMRDALAEGEWIWALPFVGAGVLSVVVRAWRWGLLIDALPEMRGRVPLSLTTTSVFIGYLVNYAAPRLGEVARTANVARRTEATFTGVLGTVVAERVLDVAALAATLGAVALLYGDRLAALTAEFRVGTTDLIQRATGPGVWIAALVLVAVAAGTLLWVRSRPRGGAVTELLATFRDGVLTAVRTRRAPALLASTAALWACYALMADFPLRLLGISQAYGLSHSDAWAIMAIGGIGMALPAPGGTGSFHYATVQAMTLLFAVAVTPAATYAILVHAAGIAFYAVCGGLSLLAQGASLRDLTRSARAASSAS